MSKMWLQKLLRGTLEGEVCCLFFLCDVRFPLISMMYNERVRNMSLIRSLAGQLVIFFFAMGMAGCAVTEPADLDVSKVADYSDRRGQANVQLYMYSGTPKVDDIKTYTEKLGCNMLHAYFYPDTIPLSEIPVEEINAAKSFTEAQEILFNGEGFARWRFSARCFAVIPIVADCNDRFAGQNCR